MEQKSGNGNKEFPILFDFKERIQQFSIFRRKPQIVIILENGVYRVYRVYRNIDKK